MEQWRLYTCDLTKTDFLIEKWAPIPKGLYHLAIEVWILNGKGQMFLVQRSDNKRFHPGEWECIGGSVIGDETFSQAAIREIGEEIGLTVSGDELMECGYEVRNRHIVMTYILRRDFPVQAVTICANENQRAAWFSIQEFEVLQKDCFVHFLNRRYDKYVKEEVYRDLLTTKPASITRLTQEKEHLIAPKRGLPYTGCRPDNSDFFLPVRELNDIFMMYGQSLPLLPTEHEDYDNNMGGGSPMKAKPFPGVREAVMKILDSDQLSQYPMAAGDENIRRTVLGYLKQESFSKTLTEKNIIFTSSTTQAFTLLCRLLLRPYDVVLFESPTYGLFTFAPERVGGITRFIPLNRKSHWTIESQCLAETIDQINDELNRNHATKLGYAPRVVAVYQSNPHNPIGRVISHDDREQMRAILSVCHEKGVFYIDDLLYKDLSFHKDVLPAMCIEGFESDVIALLGVSKAYGLAGIRSGMIVADEIIIRGIRDLLFQTMDSPSHLQAVILGTIFNNSPRRAENYYEYFTPILEEYQKRFALLKAGLNGINDIPSLDDRKMIMDTLARYYSNIDDQRMWINGIPGVQIVPGTEPESGFFALVDITALLGKTFMGNVLHTEKDILCYLYQSMKIKYITGGSIAWPDKSQCIARISFAAERDEIIFFVQCLREAVTRLE